MFPVSNFRTSTNVILCGVFISCTEFQDLFLSLEYLVYVILPFSFISARDGKEDDSSRLSFPVFLLKVVSQDAPASLNKVVSWDTGPAERTQLLKVPRSSLLKEKLHGTLKTPFEAALCIPRISQSDYLSSFCRLFFPSTSGTISGLRWTIGFWC